MINNITSSAEVRPQISVAKSAASLTSMSMPPILAFKTPEIKQKALLRVKKLKRGDNIAVAGEIDNDYVDTIEEKNPYISDETDGNFFRTPQTFCQPPVRIIKYLKNCYVIDYIESPKPKCGLGTQAVKELVEKAMFDPRTNGRVVTYSSPMVKEASPAMFFYKLGFRFTNSGSNEYMDKCLREKIPDIPAQTGIMYLPKSRIHKLLRYGEMF